MDSEYLGPDETGGWKRGKGRVAESAHEDFEPESLFFKYLSKRHKKFVTFLNIHGNNLMWSMNVRWIWCYQIKQFLTGRFSIYRVHSCSFVQVNILLMRVISHLINSKVAKVFILISCNVGWDVISNSWSIVSFSLKGRELSGKWERAILCATISFNLLALSKCQPISAGGSCKTPSLRCSTWIHVLPFIFVFTFSSDAVVRPDSGVCPEGKINQTSLTSFKIPIKYCGEW